MNTLKRTAAAAMVCVLLVCGAGRQTVLGNTFSDDVPENHWAYQAIDRVTNLGIMYGKTVTQFDLNGYISKFETVRILAMLAGYKSTGAPKDELDYFDECFENQKKTIYGYSNNFSNWNHEYDMQIAFLLELGILIPNDLEKFMIIQDGSENLLALLRMELCIYFARLLGVDEVARSFVPSQVLLFTDDTDIPAAAKPYIYYIRHIGIISGDTEGKFNPNGPVLKSTMAVMLDKLIDMIGYSASSSIGSGSQIGNGGESQEGTVSGQITQIHSSFRAIEVFVPAINEKEVYPVLFNAAILINDEPALFDSLKIGMEITGKLVDKELSEITAAGLVAAVPTPTPPPQTGSGGSAVNTTLIDGTVKTTRTSGSDAYIDVSVKLINSKSEIYEEIRTFQLDGECAITRGYAETDFLSIAAGDLVRLSISGTTVYKIYLEEKYRSISGNITDKRIVESTGMCVFSVTDDQGRVHELVTTENSIVSRTSPSGTAGWKEVKLGDKVVVSAEYDRILTMSATGVRSFIDAVITKISITASYTLLTVLDTSGDEREFRINTDSTTDPYALRVSDFVTLGMDSMEVENIMVLSDRQDNEFSGKITDISGNSLTVLGSSPNDYRVFAYDTTSTAMDLMTGTRVAMSALSRDMRVSLTFESVNQTKFVKTITMLGY